MNAELKNLYFQIERAQRKFTTRLAFEQTRCKHSNIYECDYTPSSAYFKADPPFRVCRDCGISEIGWGPGYIVLTEKAILKERDELYRMRHGLALTDLMKGQLLRKEKTIEQLCDSWLSSFQYKVVE